MARGPGRPAGRGIGGTDKGGHGQAAGVDSVAEGGPSSRSSSEPTVVGAGTLLHVPFSTLKVNTRNARIHGEDQIERLVRNIETFGMAAPIVVRRENMMIIAGHARHEALKRLGANDVDVVAMDVDQDVADRMMAADNRLAQLARDDDSMLAALLGELSPDELYPLGFDEADAAEASRGLAGRAAVVKEVPVGDVQDTFWLVVRGPMAMQADALQKARVLMGMIDGVTVELGSTKVEYSM